jgi:phosphohistidine phosphatase SixA
MMHILSHSDEFPYKVAIILRHAERHPIVNYINALDPCLTEKGMADAYHFGRFFKEFDPIKLYHSPVLRCKQTADSIFSGLLSINRKATLVGHLSELGGPYITSPWEGITANLEHIGHAAFIRKWFNYEFPSEYIMPLDLAAKSQLRILINQLNSDDSSTINITHDWNIMLLREYYFNLRHEDIGEPEYLDGLCAYILDDSLHLIYRQFEKIIDPTTMDKPN